MTKNEILLLYKNNELKNNSIFLNYIEGLIVYSYYIFNNYK